MKKVTRGLVLSAAIGAAVYVGFAAYADWGRVQRTLATFDWRMLAVALALAATNYLVRFVKWHYYLGELDVRVPRLRSLAIFLSGFTLTVTPGKMGEVVKSYFLRESDGVPMARTAPVVVAERVTDLIALVLLAATGALTYKVGVRGIALGGALVALFVGTLSSGRLMRALARRAGEKAVELYESMAVLIRPRPLAVATVLSVFAWACECLAFWFVIRGFAGAQASVGLATFIYATMTIAGALSFLPGGLGVTEAGMTALLVELAGGVDKATAFAATFVVRLCTLWFAVAVGLVALAIVQRRYHVAVDQARAAAGTPAPTRAQGS
jgi:uncharacterized membrane protein YbhN (UPF0104 family)